MRRTRGGAYHSNGPLHLPRVILPAMTRARKKEAFAQTADVWPSNGVGLREWIEFCVALTP